MRQAARRKAPRAQVSMVRSVPPPTGGWNARDAIAAMHPGDAVKLTNIFPTTADCKVRGGQADYSTSITGLVETLAVYTAADGSQELWAADDNDMWDCTSSGAASAASTTVTDGKFQWVNFSDGTSQYLVMVNGTDAPLYYNGTSWTVITGVSSPALTGVTLTSLVHVTVYQSRLFFIEKNSLSFWYLAAGAAGGALTEFQLDSYAKRGGYLMWAATWSFDGGDGPDDAIVFMTSEGEAIVYRGTDPSTAANWVLAGVYFLGKPLGRRSFVNMGSDLVAITQNGAFPFSSALNGAAVNNSSAISDKIRNAFVEQARLYGSNFGWEAVVYPLESALIVNIPVAAGGTHYQYVMNTITGAWCDFTDWNCECFAVYNNELYYGANTVVQKAWTGTTDDGADIVAIGKTAFTNMGDETGLKNFKMFRPMFRANGSFGFLTVMDVDFSDNEFTGLASSSSVTGAVWDTDNWDSAYWSGGLETIRQWTSPVENVGYYVAGGVKLSVNGVEIRWSSNDYLYEKGGVL